MAFACNTGSILFNEAARLPHVAAAIRSYTTYGHAAAFGCVVSSFHQALLYHEYACNQRTRP